MDRNPGMCQRSAKTFLKRYVMSPHKLVCIVAVLNSCYVSAANNCTDFDMKHIVYRENTAFAKEISYCGHKALGDRQETTSCLLKKFPSLSFDCADCFGDSVHCAGSECFLQCSMSDGSEDCVACYKEQCLPVLVRCTGIAAEKLPSRNARKRQWNLQLAN